MPQVKSSATTPDFKWQMPLPPAPDGKLDLTDSDLDMHSKYCEYWRAVRSKMQDYMTVSEFTSCNFFRLTLALTYLPVY